MGNFLLAATPVESLRRPDSRPPGPAVKRSAKPIFIQSLHPPPTYAVPANCDVHQNPRNTHLLMTKQLKQLKQLSHFFHRPPTCSPVARDSSLSLSQRGSLQGAAPIQLPLGFTRVLRRALYCRVVWLRTAKTVAMSVSLTFGNLQLQGL